MEPKSFRDDDSEELIIVVQSSKKFVMLMMEWIKGNVWIKELRSLGLE